MRDYAARNGIVAISELAEVSRRIKELRKRSGLKQYEVAAKINVPPRTYQSWENGEVETDKSNYAKVGRLFGASANWILFGQEHEPGLDAERPPAQPDETLAALKRIEERLSELEAGQAEMARRRKPKSGKTNTAP